MQFFNHSLFFLIEVLDLLENKEMQVAQFFSIQDKQYKAKNCLIKTYKRSTYSFILIIKLF